MAYRWRKGVDIVEQEGVDAAVHALVFLCAEQIVRERAQGAEQRGPRRGVENVQVVEAAGCEAEEVGASTGADGGEGDAKCGDEEG